LIISLPYGLSANKFAKLEKCGAAVHIDGLAGDGAGMLRAQEERGAGDFVDGLRAALQQRAQKSFQLFLGTYAHFLGQCGSELLRHYGLGYWTGAERIDAHSFAASFGRGDPRQTET